MPLSPATIPLVLAVALAPLLAAPAFVLTQEPEPDWAAACEAVAWEFPLGLSDSVPPGLRAIEARLLSGGEGALAEMEAQLDRSLHLRRIAARPAANGPDAVARRILLRLLADPDAHVASRAAFHAGDVGGREFLEPLLAALATRSSDSGHAMVRHDALNAIARLGFADAAERAGGHLLAALDDESNGVRLSALDALAELRAPAWQERALPAVRALADGPDEDRWVRERAERTARVLAARLGA